MRPFKRFIVDVFVSKALLERALDCANRLFLYLEARGHGVTLGPVAARKRDIAPELRQGQPRSDTDWYCYMSTGRWSPGRPTMVSVNGVAIGLKLFEVSEEVEARYDSRQGKYVRVDPRSLPELRRTEGAAYDWRVSKCWLPSGRMGVHAYALEDVHWERHWYESKAGELPRRFGEIATALEQGAEAIQDLIAAAEKEREERRREWEAELDRRRKQQEEEALRRKEQEGLAAVARREGAFVEKVRQWRLAQDIREYVLATRGMVGDAGLQIVPGGSLDEELGWALELAEKLDPLAPLRGEVARLRSSSCLVPCAASEARPGYCRDPGGRTTRDVGKGQMGR